MFPWLWRFKGPIATVLVPAITLSVLSAIVAILVFSGKSYASSFVKNSSAVVSIQKDIAAGAVEHKQFSTDLTQIRSALDGLVRATAEVAEAQKNAALMQQASAVQITALSEQIKALGNQEAIDRQAAMDRDSWMESRLNTLH